MSERPKSNPLAPVAVFALAGLLSASAIAVERSGKAVVTQYCSACHDKGVDGAPRIDDRQAWATRAAGGLDRLTNSAINGVRNMPAHGGQSNLTDIEMSRAVAYMLSGGRSTDTAKSYVSTQTLTGTQVVDRYCASCHLEGVDGAPKLGDLDAWRARLGKGVAGLSASAITGHQGMPARGGFASLNDIEMKAAITDMVIRLGANR